MRIVAINGSHRGDKGYTQFLIDRLFTGASGAGADCETIVLAKLKIQMCKGCRLCQSADHYMKCIFDKTDDVKEIFERIRSADIVVYASPIYIFTITSMLKSLLERFTSVSDSSKHLFSQDGLFFHHTDRTLCSKPFVVILCQNNIEGESFKNAIEYFKTFSRFLDAPIVGTIIRKSASAVGYGRDREKENKFPKIKTVHAAIEDAGRELVVGGSISRSTQNKACMDVLAMPLPVRMLLKIPPVRKIKSFTNKILEKSQK